MTLQNVIIINARLPLREGLQNLAIIEGKITHLSPTMFPSTAATVLDLAGDWLSLGGMDLQINGGLGLAFPDLEREHFPLLDQISQYLWEQGVDSYTPTLVTTAVGKIQQSLEVINEYMSSQNQEKQAQIIGVHLEGPFLNFSKRGAHPEQYLLPLNLANIKRVLGDYSSVVKIITLAPELEEEPGVISYLSSLGITVSLGHSMATASQAKKAFQEGATMVTHAFNAMPSLHHREAGLLGEAIITEGVYCGLIADGEHVNQTMLKIFLKAADRSQGIFLVSDALAPLGLPDGLYPWDTREIEVKNGTARLPDGTLSGTTFPLLVGVENLVNWRLCGVEEAIAMATESPRQALNLPGLSQGQTASFLRWHWDETTQKLTWQRLF